MLEMSQSELTNIYIDQVPQFHKYTFEGWTKNPS